MGDSAMKYEETVLLNFPDKLIAAIAYLQKELGAIPVEHQNKAFLKFSNIDTYGDTEIELMITYHRPFTAFEKFTQERNAKHQQQIQETRERELLETLKAKYPIDK